MLTTTNFVAAIIIGYLLGSIPVARLYLRRRPRVDMGAAEVGEPGAVALRSRVGTRAALPALIGEGFKGFLIGVVGLALGGKAGAQYICIVAGMVGMAFPAFARLRGGSTLFVLVGAALALQVIAWIAALELLVVATMLVGSKWGYRVGIASFVVWQYAIEGNAIWALCTIILLVLYGLGQLRLRHARPPAETEQLVRRASRRAAKAEKEASKAGKQRSKAQKLESDAREHAEAAHELATEAERDAGEAERKAAEGRQEQPSKTERRAHETGEKAAEADRQAGEGGDREREPA